MFFPKIKKTDKSIAYNSSLNEEYVSVYQQRAFHNYKKKIVGEAKSFKSRFAPFIKEFNLSDEKVINEFISNDKNIIKYADLKIIERDSEDHNKIKEIIDEVNVKTVVKSFKFILGTSLETLESENGNEKYDILKLSIDDSEFKKK